MSDGESASQLSHFFVTKLPITQDVSVSNLVIWRWNERHHVRTPITLDLATMHAVKAALEAGETTLRITAVAPIVLTIDSWDGGEKGRDLPAGYSEDCKRIVFDNGFHLSVLIRATAGNSLD